MAETDIVGGQVSLRGDLVVPPGATGVVVLTAGGGGTLRCPINRLVTAELRAVGFATLLVELHDRRDLPGMSDRLLCTADWLAARPETWHLRPGFIACGEVVGATLVAAATLGRRVGALVLQDGRVDLAGSTLPRIVAPTLLVVGEDDDEAMDAGREALEGLRCDRRLHVVPSAGAVADEPVASAETARVVTDWFRRHLC